MHRGYIRIWRKIEEWDWIDDPNTFCLFIHLIRLANYKDKKWRGITIKRGEYVTSLNKLSKLTGLSVRNIRTSLDKLISTKEVTKHRQSQYTHISINNYGLYHGNDTVSDKRPTHDRQLLKKEKKEKKDIENSVDEVLKLLTETEKKKFAAKYSISQTDVTNVWEMMVHSRMSRGKPYENWLLALHNWIKPMIKNKEIKQKLSKIQIIEGGIEEYGSFDAWADNYYKDKR
jgi:hypothetical protein